MKFFELTRRMDLVETMYEDEYAVRSYHSAEEPGVDSMLIKNTTFCSAKPTTSSPAPTTAVQKSGSRLLVAGWMTNSAHSLDWLTDRNTQSGSICTMAVPIAAENKF